MYFIYLFCFSSSHADICMFQTAEEAENLHSVRLLQHACAKSGSVACLKELCSTLNITHDELNRLETWFRQSSSRICVWAGHRFYLDTESGVPILVICIISVMYTDNMCNVVYSAGQVRNQDRIQFMNSLASTAFKT